MRSILLVSGLIAGVTACAAAQQTGPANTQPPAAQATPPAQPEPIATQPPATSATQTPAPSSAQPPAAVQPEQYIVPAGTKVLLSLKSGINTKTARPGDGVYLVSSFPVVIDSHVLIPDGVYVQGIIDRVKRPGRVKGRAEVGMHFTSIIFPDGQVVPIPGVVNSLPGSSGPKVTDDEGTVQQSGSKGADVATVAKGAGIGAEGGVIAGAATGHLGEGLGYGSLAGAAAGTIYTLFSRGPDINIPQGASVEMVLQRSMALTPQNYAAVNNTSPRLQQQFDPLAQQPTLKKPH